MRADGWSCFRSQSISNPNVRNFGRSLLAGYCPTYMPDLVLHGTSSDEKLKQCLAADLVHTVQVSDPSWELQAADQGVKEGSQARWAVTGVVMGLLLQMLPGLREPVRLLRHLGTCGAGGCEHHRTQQWGKEEGLPGCRSTMGWGDPRPLTPPAAELLQGLLWAKPS